MAEQRRAKEVRRGLIQFGLAIAAIAGVAAVYFSAASSQRALDPVTLCPDDPTSITVLLVDVTDPMNLPQQQDFLNQLTGLKNSIPRYGQLTIMQVNSTGEKLLSPIITRCSPGTVADIDPLKGNPQKVQKQWTSGFSEPLDGVFKEIVRASGAERSPIMESVQSAALTEFQKPGRQNMPKRLIVASDLLQNTSGISFYKSLPSPEEFIRSKPFRRVRTDLRGVDVELWQLQRLDSSRTQPRALADLWTSAIEQQGGSVTRIYNVSG
jgi:hypothetical protein